MKSWNDRWALILRSELYLNIALDGQGETHDRIRGVPGHWEKTLDCIEELYPLKDRFKDRFRLNVNTVVCAENYEEIETLAEFMWHSFQLDGQYFNIVRGETLVGDKIKEIPAAALPRMYSFVSELTKRYGDRMFAEDDARQALREERRVCGDNYHALSDAACQLRAGYAVAFSLHRRRNDRGDRLQRDVRACELREKFAT
jgi:sulfatase maturation enzyme AslB (radical SAM superfamily)